jgi:dTMP kinase
MTFFILGILVLILGEVIRIYLLSRENARKKNYPYIICIEGLDGSGKNTISNALKQRLMEEGYLVAKESFPMYEKWHSFLVRWYLKGKFVKDPMKVNPYIASFAYAFDRFFAWHFLLKKNFIRTDYIIFDRYTTSNIAYQGMKGRDWKAQMRIARFCEFLEYKLFQLPQPNIVILLDTPVAISIANMVSRETKDIHETQEFLTRVANSLYFFSKVFDWTRIQTTVALRTLRKPEKIVDDILKKIDKQKGLGA